MDQMQHPSPTMQDALSYIDKVKKRSSQQTYDEFADILKQFQSGIIDALFAKERIVSLFRGYPDLIEGFKCFLPPCWVIEVQSSRQTQTPSVPGSPLLGKKDPAYLLDPTNTFSYTQYAPQTRLTRSNSCLSAYSTAEAISGTNSQSYPFTRSWSASCQNLFGSRYGAVSIGFGSGSGNDLSRNNRRMLPMDYFNFERKLKDRLQCEPQIYEQLLNILLIYNEQRSFKNTFVIYKEVITRELFRQCSELLKGEEDLLDDFSRILFQP